MKTTIQYYQTYGFKSAYKPFAQEVVEAPEGTPAIQHVVTPPNPLFKAKPHLKSITTGFPSRAVKKPMQTTQTPATESLCNGKEVLEAVFPSEASRPSVRTLHNMADAGQLPVYRSGKHRFYRVSETHRAFTRSAGDLTNDELARMSEGALWAEVSRVYNDAGADAAKAFSERVKGRRKFTCDVAVSKLGKMSEPERWAEYEKVRASQGNDAARDFYVKHIKGEPTPEAGKDSDKRYDGMTLEERWHEYHKTKKTKGQRAASDFFKNYIKGRS